MSTVVIIDNYDSFTYNIKHYFEKLHCTVMVYKNDEISTDKLKAISPSHLVLSPGPGLPRDSGITMQVIAAFQDHIPILGVCLGHQCIASFYGGKVVHAKRVMHAKNAIITHNNDDIFANIPNSFSVTRYHSLLVDYKNLPATLEVIAWSYDNKQKVIMGLKHKNLPIYGVQYHPEAILSEYGQQFFANFLSCRV